MGVLDNASSQYFGAPQKLHFGHLYQSLSLLDLQFGSGNSRSLGDEFVARAKLLRVHAGELADRYAKRDNALCLMPLEELQHAFYER